MRWEQEILEELLDWFEAHLDEPEVLEHEGFETAVCWFHQGAREHLDRVWEIVAVLENNGIHVEMITARNPGLIIFDDGIQVAAVPAA